jgi:small subunit ribosomal protein S20
MPDFPALTGSGGVTISKRLWRRERLVAAFLYETGCLTGLCPAATTYVGFMANTSSAKKITRQIVRRTEVNKARRSLLRTSVRKVEEAIASGDRNAAVAALKAAEPQIMRAAQKGVAHKKTASRKVSRLTHQIAKLGK